jgi:hypothetical protein
MALTEFDPPQKRVRWAPCVRIIPSRFPPIDLFERVADPADLESVYAVEALTNARLRDETGELPLVAPEDRVSGRGSSWIMAPFTHVHGPGGRFSTTEFGAYYAARSVRTAIAETRYHRERFLRATNEPPIEVGMRVLHADLSAKLHDIRGESARLPAVYHDSDYSAGQALATRLRALGSFGIVYDSVRDPAGQCAAVFRPIALANCRQAEHLGYVWDGARITSIIRKSLLT